MIFEELQIELSGSSNVLFLDSDRTYTPAWLIRLACAVHGTAGSLVECRDLCEWFGFSRKRSTIHHWYHSYAEHYKQEFTVEPDRVAVDEKQVQLGEEQTAWLYVAIDVDSKVVLHSRLSEYRGRDPAETFLAELKEKHRVEDAEFLVDGMGYLTAFARTNLNGHLDYSKRNLVEKLFQTYCHAYQAISRNMEQQSSQCRALVDCLLRLLQSPSESPGSRQSNTNRSTPTSGSNLAVP